MSLEMLSHLCDANPPAGIQEILHVPATLGHAQLGLHNNITITQSRGVTYIKSEHCQDICLKRGREERKKEKKEEVKNDSIVLYHGRGRNMDAGDRARFNVISQMTEDHSVHQGRP